MQEELQTYADRQCQLGARPQSDMLGGRLDHVQVKRPDTSRLRRQPPLGKRGCPLAADTMDFPLPRRVKTNGRARMGQHNPGAAKKTSLSGRPGE